jgi:hypothetical protein
MKKGNNGSAVVWIIVILLILLVIANPGSTAHILNTMSQMRP